MKMFPIMNKKVYLCIHYEETYIYIILIAFFCCLRQ